MPSARTVIETALSDRLKCLLAPEVVDRFVGGTHTRRFADNLLPTVPAWQVNELYAQLNAGGGSELTPNKNNKRRAHAPYSSAAMAFNAFGRWLGSESSLQVATLDGFTERLRVESKAKIRGGGTANLDVLLANDRMVVGVESKLAEHSELHAAHWRPPYTDRSMKQLLDQKWKAVMEASLDGEWQPTRLGIEQLIKHVLGLRSQHSGRDLHLVYVFWEPDNPDKHSWVAEHRAEVRELVEMVEGADVSLHASSYWTLLDEWEALPQPPPWLAEHLAALRKRYAVAV
jgi:hypothetical protein